jgi:hypothetical protein
VVPFRSTDHLLDDYAFAIDHKALRNTSSLVDSLDLPRLVVKALEGETSFSYPGQHVIRVELVHAHRDDLEAVRSKFVEEALHGRQLCNTGAAPSCPNVQQHYLTSVVIESDRIARCEIHCLEIRSLALNTDGLKRRSEQQAAKQCPT